MNKSTAIRAVSFDFFDTLIRHRSGQGRTRSLSHYLAGCGYAAKRCQDDTIYRAFESHAVEYSTDMPADRRTWYRVRLAARVFDVLDVGAGADEAAIHADAIWGILGPPAFEVYPDVLPTLEYLKGMNLRLIMISNWHSGVAHFAAELGLAPHFDHIIGSADCGFAKPDYKIFARGSDLLNVAPEQILHVGDSYEDDYVGGREAGFQVVLLERRVEKDTHVERAIRSLSELSALI